MQSRNEVSVDEAYDRVVSYPSDAASVTNQLYQFGEMLLKETQERSGSIDTKATNILGYAGVILAFLVSRLPEWSPHMQSAHKMFALLAGLSAIAAATFGLFAVRTREWKWFSEMDWLETGALDDSEKIRRYHLLRMHEVNQANSRINADKVDELMWAQRSLWFSAVMLTLTLMFYLVPAILSGSSSP